MASTLLLLLALVAATTSFALPLDDELSDKELIDQLAYRAFDYFWTEANPANGLVKDRANNFNHDEYKVASIAATGFGLAALPIGVQRGWAQRKSAEARALATLRFFLNEAQTEHGWYYHFLDMKTGRRAWNCELSSIDTALLIAGALTAGQYFKGDVKRLADKLYARIDFTWFRTRNGQDPNALLICMGWKPDEGFFGGNWGNYTEAMILYVLALGSPTHPAPAASWDAWERGRDGKKASYAGLETLRAGALFMHQMTHVFVDFAGQRDRLGYNYWTSAKNATLINRQFCIDHQAKFKTYSDDIWGLTASDNPDGYSEHGALEHHDGTIAPTAAITSIFLTPKESLVAARAMYDTHRKRLWGRYGFSNAFNVDRDWFDKDVVGIDLGMMLLAIEDRRSGLIWKLFQSHPSVRKALRLAGFQKDPDPRMHVAPKTK